MFNKNSKIMKRGNLLKVVASVAIAMFVATGVFGQQKDANLSVDQAIPDTITIGKTLPYHVMPDPYFNPNYVAPTWTVSSSFQWTVDSTPAGGSATFNNATVINPQVTFTGATGTYVLRAQETSADGCAGTTTDITVVAINPPAVDFTPMGADVDQCGPLNNVDVTIAISGGKDSYKVDYRLLVEELTADKTTVLATVSDQTFTDVVFPQSGNRVLEANKNFTISNNHVTRYTYTLQGINDRISRKSDYLAGGSPSKYPAGTDDQWIVIVKPAPTTGPIYHLPNLGW